MNTLLVTACVFGVSASVSGWFLVIGTRARVAGVLVGAGGLSALAGGAAELGDVSDFASAAYRAAGLLLVPGGVLLYPRVRSRDPLSFVLVVVVVAAGLLAVVWAASTIAMSYVVVVALLGRVWWALEQADEDDRRALTWCTLAWVSAGLGSSSVAFLAESAGWVPFADMGPVYVAAAALGPPAMVVGAVRPEVVDVRGLVTRAVVAATVVVSFLAVAIGSVALIEMVSGRTVDIVPVTVLCAVLAFGVGPLQVLLRGVVDQLLFGDRPDPLTAATSLADRIGDDPAVALDAVREALVLPYACLRAEGADLASSGAAVTHTRALPLILGNDTVGEVVIGLRAGDLRLSVADEKVLRIVAPLLAQTLRARATSRSLQASREAVVSAVEEERRRLRRDLHDGLGPTLSGVAFATDAARNQLRSNPRRADELLVLLRADTAAAIAEIRRLVDGLRPPALDELGLAGAVRQYSSSLHSAAGTRLEVELDLPEDLPSLSAATEVAVYRIVVEALTNVARHADATRANVSVRPERGHLVVAVLDDGGPTGGWSPGAGITSMRERAEQVGGTLTAGGSPLGGRVQATIQLHDD